MKLSKNFAIEENNINGKKSETILRITWAEWNILKNLIDWRLEFNRLTIQNGFVARGQSPDFDIESSNKILIIIVTVQHKSQFY